MGIWSTMPLLSTLAALVIIVHSAEEERGYRRDLRPRVVDTASYEQPWRAIDSEPLIQQSTRAEAWNESPEEIPERRRPIRKRKRRPHPYLDGEPLERYQESIQGRHQDYHDSQQTPETIRRRKRPDFNYQIPDEPARPLRRRGIRRKRPTDQDIPPPKVAGIDNYENQSPQNYSKYNQFNEYDFMEQTEKSKVHSTSTYTTDNLANQPYAFDNEEYADMSRSIGYQEEHNISVNGNTKGNGLYNMHRFHESSSSADDDSQEKPNINQQTNKPSSERIVTKAESHPEDDANIMMMIKKSKVKNGTTGIIITGTERNYFPVSIPAEIVYSDYSNLPTTEEKSNRVILNGTGPNYVSFPIPADDAYFDYSDLSWIEESKTAVINVTEEEYFFSPISAEVPYTAHYGLPATKEKHYGLPETNTVMAQIINDTKPNYSKFPKPAEAPYCTDLNGTTATAKSSTTIVKGTEQYDSPKEKSNLTIFNGIKHNYFILPLLAGVPYTNNNSLHVTSEKSSMTSNITSNIATTRITTATAPTRTITIPPTVKSNRVNNSGYDNDLIIYMITTETTTKNAITASTYDSDDISKNDIYINYRNKDSKYIHFPKLKPDVVLTDITLKNNETAAKTIPNHLKYSTEKSKGSINVVYGSIEPKYINFQKLKPNVDYAYGSFKNHDMVSKIVAAHSKHSIEKSISGVNTSNIEPKYIHFPKLNQDVIISNSISKNNEPAAELVANATRSKYNPKNTKEKINLKKLNLPISNQYADVTYDTSKNIEPKTKIAEIASTYIIEKIKGVPNLDYGSIEPKYIKLPKSKQDGVVAYSSKNRIVNLDYGSIEPKYTNFPKSKQNSTYRSSKNNELLAKIVATTSTFAPKSKSEMNVDYGSKESQNKMLTLLLSKSKQDNFALGSSKNDESIKDIGASASNLHTEENNGIANVDYGSIKSKYNYLPKSVQDVIAYGTSKCKEPAVTMASTDLKNIEESDEVIYPDYKNNVPAPNFAQTDFRHNIEKFKGVLNVDNGSIEPKYINWLKSKQDITSGTSANNEPLFKIVATTSAFAPKSKGEINLDYDNKESQNKMLNLVLSKSKQDKIALGSSKNDESIKDIVVSASNAYTEENNGIANIDYGRKESQNKILTWVLSKSKQDTFALGSSKNDESIKYIDVSASNVYREESNSTANVDYGSIKSKYNHLPKSVQDVIANSTSKYKEPAVTTASSDLKNIEESNEVTYPDYETIEFKDMEESHGVDSVSYDMKKKHKHVILRTLAQKQSEFWDKVPKKIINTDKWIPNLKLQIPRITPAEYKELSFLEEELEENGVIDPLMLKQILKRSNGTSLSEILQQHNLSLSDLLRGKNEAISALNINVSQESKSHIHDISLEKSPQLNEAESKYPIVKQKSSEQKVPVESSSDEDTNETTTPMIENVTDTDDSEIESQTIKPRMSARRRFPSGIRRKLRMRPMLNSTLKAQLSRDLIALTARKYSHNNRNVTKSREWKEIVPLMVDRSTDKIYRDDATETAITTTDAPIDTTISNLEISNSSYSLSSVPDTSNVKDNEVENTAITTTEATTTITIEVTPPFEIDIETEKPRVTPIVRPAANNSVLRRQAFNNRLKRKRLKQKSTTENPSDDLMKNFLGMANLVSASQFIERTQKPYTTKQANTEYATELEDFMTTKTPTTVDGGIKSIQTTTSSSTSTTKKIPQTSTSTSTTEQSAKFEIEEILNDTMTSERLAKILRERNMTLSELVNHRERGSSHVHLADIFHNASKEPNPPEPFLTKSSIEPISKETYPLRAILEANTHETTTRTSSQDQKNYVHIPVVMDFGNNVNENGESMGIISLFNKLTDSEITIDKTDIRKDSDGTPYVSSVISVNATANDTIREGRVLNSNENEKWNDLLSFMKEHNISTFEEELQGSNKGDTEKDSIEDLDGDGLMLLDDMQHLQNFESNIAPGSDENIEIKMFERREHLSEKPGIHNNLPSNTKSVAIATASILGLAAILFLLTYIAFKWKQQRNKLRKKESFCVDQIPSPVFENRKTHKNNCSSRSISPMISNTNIYMSTLESHNGKESPDYMWNSLRKPFQ